MSLLMEEQDLTLILVREAQAGDREAFDRLAEAVQARLRSSIESWFRFQIGPPVNADDVIQETFLRAFRSFERFEWQGADSLFRWLCGIAKRALAELIRESRKHQGARDRVSNGSVLSVAESGASRSQVLRRGERFDRLQEALEQLPPEYREVIVLSRLDGLRTKEIAERMGRTPNAVKHLLARALRQLRREFGDTESLHLPDDRQLRIERNRDVD